jgi:hypothetical protein
VEDEGKCWAFSPTKTSKPLIPKILIYYHYASPFFGGSIFQLIKVREVFHVKL